MIESVAPFIRKDTEEEIPGGGGEKASILWEDSEGDAS